MDQQQLSPDGRAALAAVQKLPNAEQAKVFALLSLDLAARISDAANTAAPDKRAEASSKLVEGVQAAPGASLELRKQAFLDTYSVKVLDGGPHQVSFTIPEGKSRIDLINDAHELAQALYNHPGVHSDRLAEWQNDQQYTQVVTQATPVAVEGCVPNSTRMTRDEHESEEINWNDVDIRDLAAAQQAFFIATGKDLLDGKVVRARGGALCFNSDGLDEDHLYGDQAYSYVAASRLLPLPN